MPYLNADLQRAFQNNWMKRRREEWIASKGGVCAECGSAERLEVDHIDPSTKTCNPRSIWSRNEIFRHAELAKCQVLCYECHIVKTRAQFIKRKCGDYAMYKSGKCRCVDCKAANATRRREQRAAKKLRDLALAS